MCLCVCVFNRERNRKSESSVCVADGETKIKSVCQSEKQREKEGEGLLVKLVKLVFFSTPLKINKVSFFPPKCFFYHHRICSSCSSKVFLIYFIDNAFAINVSKWGTKNFYCFIMKIISRGPIQFCFHLIVLTNIDIYPLFYHLTILKLMFD